MRVGYLRTWLERFNPSADLTYDMDTFHPTVIPKIRNEEEGKDYTLNLNTGECFMPHRENKLYDPNKYDRLKEEQPCLIDLSVSGAITQSPKEKPL